jgi:hypothetical protein
MLEVFIMTQVLVRGLEPEVVESLKKRAEINRRSLQGELKVILEEAARNSRSVNNIDELLTRARTIREQTAGRIKTDSADLIREDRER